MEVGCGVTVLLLVLVAAWIAGAIRPPAGSAATLHWLFATGAGLVVANLVFSLRGMYRDGLIYVNRLSAAQLAAAWTHAFGVWLLALLVLTAAIDFLGYEAGEIRWFDPLRLTIFYGAGLASVMCGRLLLIRAFAASALAPAVCQRICIVGTGEAERSVAEQITRNADPSVQLLGFFTYAGETAGPAGLPFPMSAGMPVLGSLDTLAAMARQGRVDQVLVSSPGPDPHRIESLMRLLANLPVSVGLVLEERPIQYPHRLVHLPSGLPVMRVCEQQLSDWSRILKRLEDLSLAVILLVAFAPLMLLIAAIIKADSPGPVLFSQPRYGIDNRTIRVHKFRTMQAHLSDASGCEQAVRGDRRLTRVGAFLRRFSLDELPQLFNVLCGEMSIVGPRPHALSTKAEGRLFEDAVANYMGRHRVKPGMTGWAQVNGWRGETDTLEKISRRVEHDLYYIGNWSSALDLFILLRTIAIVIRGENAH